VEDLQLGSVGEFAAVYRPIEDLVEVRPFGRDEGVGEPGGEGRVGGQIGEQAGQGGRGGFAVKATRVWSSLSRTSSGEAIGYAALAGVDRGPHARM
jgi:hypothetical protein